MTGWISGLSPGRSPIPGRAPPRRVVGVFLLASAVERFGPVLLVLPLLLVGRAVRGLPDRPDRARLRRSARAAIGWLALAGAGLVARAAAVAGTALAVGADPRVGFAALLLAVASTARVRGTLPLLLGLARSARPPVDPAARAVEAVARPARLLPVAAAAAAVLTAAAQAPVRAAGLVVLALVAVIVAVDVGSGPAGSPADHRRSAGRPGPGSSHRWPWSSGRPAAGSPARPRPRHRVISS